MLNLVEGTKTYVMMLPEEVSDFTLIFPAPEDDEMDSSTDMGDKSGDESGDESSDMGDKSDDSKDMSGDESTDVDSGDESEQTGDSGDTTDTPAVPDYVYIVSDDKVYKVQVSNPSERTEISLPGGSRPQLSSSGSTLYYLASTNRLMAQEVDSPATQRVVFTSPRIGEYVVSADQQKIFYVEEMLRSFNVFNTGNNNRRVLLRNFPVPDSIDLNEDNKYV